MLQVFNHMFNQELVLETVQWNLSCEAEYFALEKWSFNRGGLSSGVDINAFML